jgi:hypothetical protein
VNYQGEIIKGTLAYTLVTFPLAVVWHVILFESQYQVFGYFEGEPSFVLGFTTILLQGLLLSYLYPHVGFSGNGAGRGIKYALFIGFFFWTSHVLAFVAKQDVTNGASFIFLESIYLSIQFLIFGFLIGRIYRKSLQSGLVW